MAEEATRWLQTSIREFLLPAVEERGFVALPLTPKERRSEFSVAFPYGRHRRRGPNGIEQVEIQLDKNGGAAFRLNLGAVPDAGVTAWGVNVSADDVWVTYLNRHAQLYASARRSKWFSAHKWLRSVSKMECEALVASVRSLLPEVDDYFRDGTVGPHIRVTDIDALMKRRR